ncbi:MAG: hypothetical protein IT427_06670 [Pirellulales bacterium]|nr:hypothetical protein [Pirellulales bacterium]
MRELIASQRVRSIPAQAKAVPMGIFVALGAVLAQSSLPFAAADTLDNAPLATRDLHVWGRFDAGSWKRVRIVTETLNDHGEVSSAATTETKTTLLGVNSKSLRLKIEATVDLDGKRFTSQSRVIEYGFFSPQPSASAEMQWVGTGHVTIGDRRLPCQVRQVTASSGGTRHVTKLYLSDSIEPFVLKRETATIEANGKPATNLTSTVEVIALDMPVHVQREMKSAAIERTIQHTPQGTSETLDWTCVDVPGGIVSRTSKELDEKGKLLRRSTLELVDYHVELEEGKDDNGPRYLNRRQARKAARRGR